MADVIEVAGWIEAAALPHHDEVWSAWVHGHVAAVRSAGRLLLLVPVVVLTPAVVALALRLYRLGEIELLTD